jgi:DNA (cytosine-5)-methyltransferase 1
MSLDSTRTFYEFFAGAGMARLGLGGHWTCLLANDFDPAKAESYAANFGDEDLKQGDIAALKSADLPGRADLAWASFPCQDLSLAGARAGLSGARSGTFFAFWRLMQGLAAEGRAPRLIALENVVGLLTSRGGADFATVIETLAAGGYRVGAMVLDAADFLPQSRPRLFIIGALGPPPGALLLAGPNPRTAPAALQRAVAQLSPVAKEKWVWWDLPAPPMPNTRLEDLVDWNAPAEAWRSDAETQTLLTQMSATQRARIEALRTQGGRAVGALYRRIRVEDGKKVQRAEARFDGLAGCLRTPGGGSSRQFLLFIDKGAVRSRLMSPREAARLMGLPDDYLLPDSAHKALHLVGDGVAAPVVAFLERTLFAPLLGGASSGRSVRKAKAA